MKLISIYTRFNQMNTSQNLVIDVISIIYRVTDMLII